MKTLKLSGMGNNGTKSLGRTTKKKKCSGQKRNGGLLDSDQKGGH